MMDLAHETVERVVRDSYGRLVALLASRSRNIAAAEDALSEALLSALRHWPVHGIPANPDGWMMTAARNVLSNGWRHQAVMADASTDLELLQARDVSDGSPIQDERLKLMFICANPAIAEDIRAPLMLQTVLGLDAVRIGNAFLVLPTTMGQRLVRAKTKIRDAGMRFELPAQEDMPGRVADVLNAIYVAYGVGWDGIGEAQEHDQGLAQEAIYLARLVVSLLPDAPEAMGLLSLLLYCEARRAARRDAQGRFVPLDRQDHRLWSRDMISEAEGLLIQASRFARFGRFQCEAAIQSVHAQRSLTGQTRHAALITLYRLLIEHTGSLGARIALAAVYLEAQQPRQGLNLLETLPLKDVQSHQPFWVTRARLLFAVGDTVAASSALDEAIALTKDAAARLFLEGCRMSA